MCCFVMEVLSLYLTKWASISKLSKLSMLREAALSILLGLIEISYDM